MKCLLPGLLSLLSFCSAVSAVDLGGSITWNDVCPSFEKLGNSKVVLNDGKIAGGVRKDGSFLLPDIPSGTHLLSVQSHDFIFDQLRIDVINATEPTIEVRPYVPGTPLNPSTAILLPSPITLTARQKLDYFVPHESFNLVGMFQNPMMIMMVLAGVMMLATPYLMKNMDPDAMEDMRASQAKAAQAQNALASGDLKSVFSALMPAEEPPQPSKPAPAATQSKPKGNKGKRR
ncbi:hypothetical protein HGRIS_007721 [Hohenbuehelia grisea]|uniref:ER membrane protein complex subunit 7 beta-sandwich domain-containing protein n=1 Tax=Hohenbuehelia grisea TaxID=104357 RepID=A0ABR3J5R9_9AGAR